MQNRIYTASAGDLMTMTNDPYIRSRLNADPDVIKAAAANGGDLEKGLSSILANNPELARKRILAANANASTDVRGKLQGYKGY
jgi:hypothetical protein